MTATDPSPRQIAALLDQTGFSDRQIAFRLNCDPKTVNNWRHGHQTPPREVLAWLANIAKFLQVYPPPDFRELRGLEE